MIRNGKEDSGVNLIKRLDYFLNGKMKIVDEEKVIEIFGGCLPIAHSSRHAFSGKQ
jgi:hypothetical protein